MKIISIILALIVVGAGYYFYFGKKEEVKPPADPLTASAEQINSIYKMAVGPYKVAYVDNIDLTVGGRDLPVRVAYPVTDSATEKFPLVLFSHGNWSDQFKYDNVVNHWVSHGYVVVMPYHLDGGGAVRGITNSVRYGQLGLINTRVEEYTYLLDHWADIEATIPALQGKVDTTRIAATGHSFGGFTAQQMGGAQAFDPDKKEYIPSGDKRVRAIVAISPPGEMFTTIKKGSWDKLNIPTLVTSGTWDSNPSFWPDWRMHLLSYETAMPGDKFQLVTQGADHYLGNLICRPDREEAPQHDALKMLNAVSTAFLDAYVKDSAEAKQFLQDNKLSELTGGFSTLSQR
jgi:predicted dienelactone hydrolase